LLFKAAGYGSSTAAAWGVTVLPSDYSSDNKPLIVSSAQPVLSGYLLSIDYDATQAQAQRNDAEIWNSITVQYSDLNGRTLYYTPTGSATLKDQTSIDLYGQRDYLLRLSGTLTAAQALSYGVRFLTENKYPRMFVDSPIAIRDSVPGQNGEVYPACQVLASMKIRINGLAEDVTTAPFIGMISRTRYTHDNQTVQIWLSRPDNLTVQLARLSK